MKQIFCIFNENNVISQCMDAQYDNEGNIIMFDSYEGPFQVSDDFGRGDNQIQCYYLKDNQLVIDIDAVSKYKKDKNFFIAEENKLKSRARAMQRLQEIEAQKIAQSSDKVDDIIAIAPLLCEWYPKQYTIGEIIQFEGLPYHCIQNHNATENINWNPLLAVSLWASYHSTSAEYALPWVQPTGAHDAYQTGEYMIWNDGNIYKCIKENIVHDPSQLSAAWKKNTDIIEEEIEENESISDNFNEPDEPIVIIYPDWKQPIGPEDAYNMNDFVTYNAIAWKCSIDSNVWKPGEYGWTQI